MIIQINDELDKYNNMLKIIDKFQMKEPKGYLKYQEKNGHYFYYEAYRDLYSGKEIKHYIKKKDISLAKRLAQKHYYARIKSIAEKNVMVLEKVLEHYDEKGIDLVYEKLLHGRKMLVTPIIGSKEAMIREWNMLPDDATAPFQENRKYKTDKGEYVRSKSEVIIANTLYAKCDALLYKYEPSLELIDRGKKVIFHPDFKVLNIRTGRIVYWEHFGMLDNPYYANDFTNKINTYINSGYILGKDLFISVETSEIPLDTRSVKRIINEICQG